MKHRSRGETIACVSGGVALIAGGVVLLFIPGPGLLLILFGLALVASQSEWLAARLDRFEPWGRRTAHRVKEHWKRQSAPTKVSLVIGATAMAAAALLATWQFVVAPYVA